MKKLHLNVVAGLFNLFICVSVQAARTYAFTSFDYPGGDYGTEFYDIDGNIAVGSCFTYPREPSGIKYDRRTTTSLNTPPDTTLTIDHKYWSPVTKPVA